MHLIRFITLFALILFNTTASFANEIPEIPVLFRADIIQVNSNKVLALSYQNYKKWHTYWKNPGDAGLETKYEFSLNDKSTILEEFEWPAPNKYIESGNMLAYGYQDEYSFFFKLPENSENKKIKISSKWLVCKHVCIPGKASVSGVIKNFKFSKSAHQNFNISEVELIKRFKNLPKEISTPKDLNFNLIQLKGTNSLALYYTYSSSEEKISLNNNRNLLFPYPSSPLDIRREELKFNKGQLYGKLLIDWDGEYSNPPQEFPANGKFKKVQVVKFLFFDPITSKASVIKQEFKGFKISDESSEKFFSSLSTDSDKNKPKEKPLKKESLIYYIIFAFLGGLILNVMPCVLPVISLKLFGLIKYQESSRSEILKHNLFYTLGVLLTFFSLALTVVLLKASGESVGWGFQLQSPLFVSIMVIILFIFSLNLFGLFEFRAPGGGLVDKFSNKEGPLGHIFEGILATILSTPCSAPFLGTALTFAFTSGTAGIFIIFTFVGLGLSFPFLFTAVFPNTIKFLPKPGSWMNTFKKFLGLTLLLTMIWLFDVFSSQVSTFKAFIELLLILFIIFAAIMIHHKFLKDKKLRLFIYIIPLALTLHLLTSPLLNIKTDNLITKAHKNFGLSWEPWSVEYMAQLQKNKQISFIDFTAKWCFTCKVNERLVLNTKEFKKIVKDKNVTLLLADWTKRDEKIGKWLESQGLVGVPAYFVINSKGELIPLGETISISEIESNLK